MALLYVPAGAADGKVWHVQILLRGSSLLIMYFLEASESFPKEFHPYALIPRADRSGRRKPIQAHVIAAQGYQLLISEDCRL